MNADTPPPEWDATIPYHSLTIACRWLHGMATDMFLEEKTHGNILFLLDEQEGLASINQIPPEATEEQVYKGVRQAIRENNIYAAITISESWTYFPKTKKDHTVVQLMHNEMKVADLRDDDKVECLMVKMECKDGDGFILLNRILRDGDEVSLGDTMRVPLDNNLKQDRLF